MKRLLFIFLLICSTSLLFAQNSSADETAIRSIIQKQEEFWNNHDMIAFSQFFTEDATLINFIGMFWKGRKDIIDHFQAINDCCLVPTSVKFDYKSLRRITPEVAIVYIEETIVADRDYNVPDHHYKKGETEYKLITAIFIKNDDEWKITAHQLTLINQLFSPHTPAKIEQ